MTRDKVYALIDQERDYQDDVWAENHPESEHPLRVGEDLLLLQKYVDDATDVWTRESRPEVKTMDLMRKIAAIAVRSIESNGAPPRFVNRQPEQTI